MKSLVFCEKRANPSVKDKMTVKLLPCRNITFLGRSEPFF